MIGYLKGKIKYHGEGFVILDTGGIGFKVFIPPSVTLPPQGEDLELYTYLNIGENVMDLYGFVSPEHLHTFEMLISVSGVGPKAALAILTVLNPSSLSLAIVTGDIKAITAAKGVGPKVAQRIIIELKDKVSNEELTGAFSNDTSSVASGGDDNASEATAALVALGYSLAEAASAVKGIDATMPAEDIIKAALKKLM